jgi:hypothetical protein
MSSARRPDPVFPALDGLCGLTLPFLLAFSLRPHLLGAHLPGPLLDLAGGGFLVVDVLLVVIGFRLCRPLADRLADPGRGPRTGAWVRRSAAGPIGLHLTAWLVTAIWVLSGAGARPGTGVVVDGSAPAWISSALLLNGVTGPDRAGYPLSWAVSVAVGGVLLLTAVAAVLRHRRGAVPFADPGPAVTGIAVGTGLSGVVLLVLLPDRPLGQGLLGLACGLLAYRVLEGSTGPLAPPTPGIRPKARREPGPGPAVALVITLICVHRWDLMLRLHLLPVFAAAAGLVHLLARPPAAPAGSPEADPVRRLFLSRPAQWLGEHALAIVVVQGPIQLSAERIGRLLGAGPGPAFSLAVVVVVVLGSFGLAGALTSAWTTSAWVRHVDPAVDPAADGPLDRRLRTRAERIGRIDLDSIPRELRLRPLPPRRPSPSNQGSAEG